MKKPEKIYYEEEKKKFNYNKPEGWDKKPPLINIKEFKPTWWQILKDGLKGEDMEPKYFMKYEGWMHELKIIGFTAFTTLCIIYIVFNSSFIRTSAMDSNDDAGLLNRGIDYILGRYDEWKGLTPQPAKVYNSTDTTVLYQPTITQQELDSIINMYNNRLDSLKNADSLSTP